MSSPAQTSMTVGPLVLEGRVEAGNDSRYFAAALGYGAVFGTGQGLRPHIKIEFSFRGPARAPIARPIRSLIAAAQNAAPEVDAFPCVDVIETAADKLSALAWRVRSRQRGGPRDDPTIIRHLHNLAALEKTITSVSEFRELVLDALAADRGRGGEADPPTDPAVIFDDMLQRLQRDPLWAREYEEFVAAVSFAASSEEISFADAVGACRRLIGAISGGRA